PLVYGPAPCVVGRILKWVFPVEVCSTTSSLFEEITVPVAVKPLSGLWVGTAGLVRFSWVPGTVVMGLLVSVGWLGYCADAAVAISPRVAVRARTTRFMGSASFP